MSPARNALSAVNGNTSYSGTGHEVVVLVGGYGERLKSVVSDVPKALAPVAGKPFLFLLLDNFRRQGMSRVVLATGYKGNMIREACGSCWDGMKLDYSHEDVPRGTGGAVAAASLLMEGDGYFVVNGDTWLDVDYSAFARLARKSKPLLCMALAAVADTSRYGAVLLNADSVIGFAEKGRTGNGMINAGVYWLDAHVNTYFPANEAFSLERDVLEPLVKQGRVSGFSETRDFIDIGVPEDYILAQKHFSAKATS